MVMPVSRLKKSHLDVLRILKEEKGTPRYVAKRLEGKYTVDTVRKRLQELAKWGYAERISFGFYTITEKGLRILER